MSNTYKIADSTLSSTIPIGNGGTYAIHNSPKWGLGTNGIGPSTTLQVDGRIVINERDLEERLSTIEKILQIPERDVKLEKKYPKLKSLYDAYIKELSKVRMWETLKGEDQ